MERITLEKYQNIVNMLRSPDAENHLVALSIIEQLDFNTNIAAILLCKKQGHANGNAWKEDAPNTTKQIQALGIDMGKSLTYKSVLSYLTKGNAPPEQIQFFLDDFSKRLLSQVKTLGYDFIEDLEMTIKVKEGYEISG